MNITDWSGVQGWVNKGILLQQRGRGYHPIMARFDKDGQKAVCPASLKPSMMICESIYVYDFRLWNHKDTGYRFFFFFFFFFRPLYKAGESIARPALSRWINVTAISV
jgi:hypothetical protein